MSLVCSTMGNVPKCMYWLNCIRKFAVVFASSVLCKQQLFEGILSVLRSKHYTDPEKLNWRFKNRLKRCLLKWLLVNIFKASLSIATFKPSCILLQNAFRRDCNSNLID